MWKSLITVRIAKNKKNWHKEQTMLGYSGFKYLKITRIIAKRILSGFRSHHSTQINHQYDTLQPPLHLLHPVRLLLDHLHHFQYYSHHLHHCQCLVLQVQRHWSGKKKRLLFESLCMWRQDINISIICLWWNTRLSCSRWWKILHIFSQSIFPITTLFYNYVVCTSLLYKEC